MTTIKKLAWIAALSLILVGAVGQWGPSIDWTWPTWGWVSPINGPIDQVIIIEETKVRTPAIAAVILGPTANKLREADKWKCFDQHELPVSMKPMIDQTKPTKLPWLIIDHGGKATWSGPLTATTDADFAAFLKSKGGF